LAVTSYPFREYIDYPSNKAPAPSGKRFDMVAFPGVMVEKFGIHNVNPLIEHFGAQDAAYFAKFRNALSKANSHLVDLGLSGREFYSADSAVRQAAVSDGRKWVEMAAALGSPSVRQHVKASKGQEPNVDLAAQSLGSLAEYGAQKNVVINLENDGAIAEDPFFLVSVIEKVKNPYLRALPDFGNALMAHDAAFNQKGVSAMLGHAFNMCHIKDSVQTKAGQDVSVDLPPLFKLAHSSGYRGYFSMEVDSRGSDPFAGTQRLVNETLKCLG
jgi:sugar phosphate isomerase/epimerase